MHTLVVERAGRPERVLRVNVEPGGERTVHILPEPELPAPAPVPAEESPVFSKPAFWAITAGAVALLTVGAIILAVVLAGPEDQRLTPRTTRVYEL